jgi:hypothetical protein
MSSRSRHLGRGILVAAAIGLLSPLVGALPAQAAVRCTSVFDDGVYATANCTGSGSVRINATCNAIWPFSPWIDYGPWLYLTNGASIVNPHISCAASVTAWVQYG